MRRVYLPIDYSNFDRTISITTIIKSLRFIVSMVESVSRDLFLGVLHLFEKTIS